MESAETKDEQYKEFKKLALRFLKETNLYPAWVRYVNNPNLQMFLSDKLTKENWYKKALIDRVFGEATFTDFLKIQYNIRLNDSSTTLFRGFLSEVVFPKKKMRLFKHKYPSNELIKITKDEDNNLISIENFYDFGK